MRQSIGGRVLKWEGLVEKVRFEVFNAITCDVIMTSCRTETETVSRMQNGIVGFNVPLDTI